jgi:hypothetical protein
MADFQQVPGVLNITTTRDDDVTLILTWKDANSLPMDLTGYTFVAEIDGTTNSILTVTNTDLVNGIISVVIPKTVLAAYIDGIYGWHLTRTIAGLSRRVLYGNFTLKTKGKNVL